MYQNFDKEFTRLQAIIWTTDGIVYGRLHIYINIYMCVCHSPSANGSFTAVKEHYSVDTRWISNSALGYVPTIKEFVFILIFFPMGFIQIGVINYNLYNEFW